MVTPTNHQWAAINEAASWFSEATKEFVPNVRPEEDDYEGWMHYSPRTMEYGLSPGQAFVFAGYAGSGKSTCVSAMIEKLGLKQSEVMYMAPTGKAAKVLSTKLRAAGWYNPATTIHKAIYMPQLQKSQEIKDQLDRADTEWDQRVEARGRGEADTRFTFEHMNDHELQVLIKKLENELADAMDSEGLSFTLKDHKHLPEGVKLMVVDEASMVPEEIANDLGSFNLPILAIGDPGQLPPVEGRWGFAMEDPDVFLSEIHRQAAENPIIRLATMAREGELIKPGNYGDGVKVVTRRNDDVTLNTERDAMVLVGTHKKRFALTMAIRDELGIKSSGPVADEPILVQRNSRTYPALVNGSILTCLEDVGDLQDGGVSIDIRVQDPDQDALEYTLKCPQALFEEHHFKKRGAYSGPTKAVYQAKATQEHLDWGHVLTVHKAQGSEWDDVVVHDESGVFRGDGDRWLYTGITRAAEKLTLVV